MPQPMSFHSDRHLRIGETDFHCSYPLRDVPPGFLPVMKTRQMVEAYAALGRDEDPERVVELGIHSGGSTAMLSELYRPQKLVAIELSEGPVVALDAYIEARSLGDVVRPYFGQDQSDREGLAAILDREFVGAPIDLVIDDASHIYEPTLASFEVLFPRLREGGLYIIEDWRWEHRLGTSLADRLSDHPDADRIRAALVDRMEQTAAGNIEVQAPLSRLVLELFLARATTGLVEDLTIGASWAVVRKGPIEPSTDELHLPDHYYDHFDQLGSYGMS